MAPNRARERANAHDKIRTTTVCSIQRPTSGAGFVATALAATYTKPNSKLGKHLTKAKARCEQLELHVDLTLIPPPRINTLSPLPLTPSPDDVISDARRQHARRKAERSPTTPVTADSRWAAARQIFETAHHAIQNVISGPLFRDAEVRRLTVLFGRCVTQQQEWVLRVRVRRRYFARFLGNGRAPIGEGVPAGEEGEVRLDRWVSDAEEMVEDLSLELGAIFEMLGERREKWIADLRKERLREFWGGSNYVGVMPESWIESDTECVEDEDEQEELGTETEVLGEVY